jgi:hypothetical protein
MRLQLYGWIQAGFRKREEPEVWIIHVSERFRLSLYRDVTASQNQNMDAISLGCQLYKLFITFAFVTYRTELCIKEI